jgi:hypothetical protein
VCLSIPFTFKSLTVKVLVESPKERDDLEDQGVGWKMGSEWIFEILAWGVWIGFYWLRTGTGGGLL